jgi:hypothetical protein
MERQAVAVISIVHQIQLLNQFNERINKNNNFLSYFVFYLLIN